MIETNAASDIDHAVFGSVETMEYVFGYRPQPEYKSWLESLGFSDDSIQRYVIAANELWHRLIG